MTAFCLEAGKALGTCSYCPQLSIWISNTQCHWSQSKASQHLCTSVYISMSVRVLELSRKFALRTLCNCQTTCRDALRFNLQERVTCLLFYVSCLLPCAGESGYSCCVFGWRLDFLMLSGPPCHPSTTSAQSSASVSAHHFLNDPIHLCFLF